MIFSLSAGSPHKSPGEQGWGRAGAGQDARRLRALLGEPPGAKLIVTPEEHRPPDREALRPRKGAPRVPFER